MVWSPKHTHLVTSTIANQQYDHEVVLEVLVEEVEVEVGSRGR